MQLEWQDHSVNLVKSMSDLLDNRCLLDLVISAEGKQVKAHRLVMAAASDFFKDVLLMDMDHLPIVYLKDVNFSEVKSLMDFIYYGKAEVSPQNMTNFLALAKSLGVKGFKDIDMPSSKSSTTSESDKKLRTPTKRKMNQFCDKENFNTSSTSPLKHSASEPVDITADLKKPRYQHQQRTASKSLDEVSRPVLGPLFKSDENSFDDSFLFKRPLPPPPKTPTTHGSTASFTAGPSNVRDRPIYENTANLVLNSTLFDPDELAEKGAKLLHHLAYWMMQEQAAASQEDQQQQQQHASNTLPAKLRHASAISGTSSAGLGRKSGSECDRPDSGFDPKDEVRSNHEGQDPSILSGGSSPESVPKEIKRQAISRQPVLRKRRLNLNH